MDVVHEVNYGGGGYEGSSAPFASYPPVSMSPFDVEKAPKPTVKFTIKPATGEAVQLKRQLKARHMSMIASGLLSALALGGVIGTGLFVGTAHSLANAGPLGLLLGYLVMGSIAWSMMISLGEMICHLPLPGGHITLAKRFVSPSFALVMGWMYWAVALPSELSAAAVLVSFWTDKINPAVFIAIFLTIVVGINAFGTRAYGESEYIFASVKIITIIGLIILGIVLDAGGGPNHKPIGFRNFEKPFVQYEQIPGALGRFLGFFSVLINASFSYIGIEITALAGGEAVDPRKTLPQAIKTVYIRILLFYVLGSFIIGLLVSASDPRLTTGNGTAAGSPFVIAIVDSGIKILPSIANAAFLVSAWSAASSDLYTSSRALYGLAVNGSAPYFFAVTTSWGLPWVGVLVGAGIAMLSFMSAGSASASTVFTWFANMTSVMGLVNWAGISFIYIRFHAGARAQGIDRNLFPYRGWGQPYVAWYAFIGCILILVFNAFGVFIHHYWSTSFFLTSYIPVAIAPVAFLASWIWKRDSWEPLLALDFFSGSRDDDEDEAAANTPPASLAQRIWRWFV